MISRFDGWLTHSLQGFPPNIWRSPHDELTMAQRLTNFLFHIPQMRRHCNHEEGFAPSLCAHIAKYQNTRPHWLLGRQDRYGRENKVLIFSWATAGRLWNFLLPSHNPHFSWLTLPPRLASADLTAGGWIRVVFTRFSLRSAPLTPRQRQNQNKVKGDNWRRRMLGWVYSIRGMFGLIDTFGARNSYFVKIIH